MLKTEATAETAGAFAFSFLRHEADTDYASGALGKGFLTPHIGYIVQGGGTFVSPRKTLELAVGDAVYIPTLYPYRSYWKAPLKFYTVIVNDRRFDGTAFAFQKLAMPSLLPLFVRLDGLLREGADETALLAAYLAVYAPIAARLARAESVFPADLIAARTFLEEHAFERVKVSQAAAIARLSEPRFFARFKQATGYAPIEYRNYVRVRRACAMLREGATVEEASAACGFCSGAYFRRQLRKFASLSPTDVKNGRGLL